MNQVAEPPFRVERDVESAPFFDAARTGHLLIRQCANCGRLYPPYQVRCRDSDVFQWIPASGDAVLVTWATDHGTQLTPELASRDGGPAVIGIVELAEGPWMSVPILGSAAELYEGQTLKARFVELGGGEPIVVFGPDADPNDGDER